MDINYFRKINNAYNVPNKREVELNEVRKSLLWDFSNSLLTFDVFINDNPQEVIILDKSIEKQTKTMISKPYEHFKGGDIVLWEKYNTFWIVSEMEPNSEIYSKGIIKRCSGVLKWIDSAGNLLERHFAFEADPSVNFGVDEGKIITLGNERRSLIVSNDEFTKELKKDKRFIFDSRAWKLISIDTIGTEGIVFLTVEESTINLATDNLELGIADYYDAPTPSPTPDPKGYTIIINGLDEIKRDRAQIYTAAVYNNGVIDEGKSVVWELNSNYATIESQDGLQCTIKAGTEINKDVVLRSSLTDDSNVAFQKTIKIVGLY